MLINRLRNTLKAPENLKTLFTSPVLDQGETEYCGENEACAEQTAVDNIVYDVLKFLDGVLGYLRITADEYTGTDLKTLMAASIDPGWTPQGQDAPTIHASACLWIYPENGMDLYDTIQYYITQYQRPVGFGVLWYNDWEAQTQGLVSSDIPQNPLGNHCSIWCGKVPAGYQGVNFPEPDRMLNQNSWGVNAPGSLNGFYLFPRKIVNQYCNSFGTAVRIFSNDRVVNLLGKLSMLYMRLIDLIT